MLSSYAKLPSLVLALSCGLSCGLGFAANAGAQAGIKVISPQLGTGGNQHAYLFAYVSFSGGGEVPPTPSPVVPAMQATYANVVTSMLLTNANVESPLLEIQPDVRQVTLAGQPSDYGSVMTCWTATRSALLQSQVTPADYDRWLIVVESAAFESGGQVKGRGTINQHVVMLDPGQINVEISMAALESRAVLAAHELGHSFAWQHANYFTDAPTPCTGNKKRELNYGDEFDIMGDLIEGAVCMPATSCQPPSECRKSVQEFNHFSPWSKVRNGWMNGVVDLSQNTTWPITVDIRPIDHATGPYAVKYPYPGKPLDYWIFWRQGAAHGQHYDRPVIVLTSRTNANRALMLNATLGTPDPDPLVEVENATLPAGQTYTDPVPPTGGLVVTNVGLVGAGTTTLRLTFPNAPTSVEQTPVVELSAVADVLGTPTPVTNENVVGQVVDYVVSMTYDPALPGAPFHGKGIQKVELGLFDLGAATDALMPTMLLTRNDNNLVSSFSNLPATNYHITYTAPFPDQLVLRVDTTQPALTDGTHMFIAEVTTSSGSRKQLVWYPHIIDN